MTNQELSAAIRDLDEQLEEFVRKNIGVQSDPIMKAISDGIAKELDDFMMKDFLSNEEGQAGGVSVETSASAKRGESREGSLRITEVPEPHQPTKWIGWLLVTFAAYCLGVLVMSIVRAK